MPKVAVILSGCGVNDGSEIHEAVLTLLHLKKQRADVAFLAPDINQTDVINHKTGNFETTQQRNILEESARIARGDIQPLSTANANDYDAVIFPGGFGAAKNLSNFAVCDNPLDAVVEEHIQRFTTAMFEQGKPLGFICISPASVGAVALKGKGVKLTIGHDAQVAEKINLLGCKHIECDVNDIVIDDENNVVSTPAYMLANNILEAEEGIQKLVEELVKRA